MDMTKSSSQDSYKQTISKTETWSLIPDTNGKYFISNYGNVMSSFKDKIKLVNGTINNYGYRKFHFRINGFHKMMSGHALVARAFIPNPKLLLIVNHIDGNKLNNNVDNLEWCTSSENQLHTYKIKLKKPSQRKGVFHNQNGIFYDSIMEASLIFMIPKSTLRASLNNNDNRFNLIFS